MMKKAKKQKKLLKHKNRAHRAKVCGLPCGGPFLFVPFAIRLAIDFPPRGCPLSV